MIWLWNERHNVMALYDGKEQNIAICDDGYGDPFYCYPLEWLEQYTGWIVIGKIK